MIPFMGVALRKISTGLFTVWVCFCISFLPYLLIPNVNYGAEHYWYFPSIFAVALVVMVIYQIKIIGSGNSFRFSKVILFLYSLFLLLVLQGRLMDLGTRRDFFLAENRLHPNNTASWVGLIISYMEAPMEPKLAEKKIEAYYRRFGENKDILCAKIYYHYKLKQREALDASLEKLEAYQGVLPRKLASFYYYSGALNFEEQRYSQALNAFSKARNLDPTNPVIRQAIDLGRRLFCSQSPALCPPDVS